MKKVILLIFCSGTLFCSFAQETSSEAPMPVLTKTDYLKKAKSQRTGAIILISAGGALCIGGTAIALNDIQYNLGGLFDTNYSSSSKNNNETLATVVVVTGLVAIASSIGLFISSHKNKRRAMALSFKNELVPQFQNSTSFYRIVPSVGLKVAL